MKGVPHETLVRYPCGRLGGRPPDLGAAAGFDTSFGNPWFQALPVGNGRLGAMVFGGVGVERIQLNEETLRSGGPVDRSNPRGPEVLAELRADLYRFDFTLALEHDDWRVVSFGAARTRIRYSENACRPNCMLRFHGEQAARKFTSHCGYSV